MPDSALSSVPAGSQRDQPGEGRTVLIANPSADVYGSDLQMLESVTALRGAGFRVLIVTPDDGPLIPRLRERGAEVELLDFPVLRRANASASGVLKIALAGGRSIFGLAAKLREITPDVVYVNTLTVPWWIPAARLARIPVVTHVHEAENTDGRLIRFALNAPLLFSTRIIVISKATREATESSVRGLSARIRLIYNGVTEPPRDPTPLPIVGHPVRVAVVARLSPRKAPDIALESVALLRSWGHDVTLDICGTPFPGYEWFEEQLRTRAAQPDLDGAVTFSGYVSPIWSALERAHIIAAPSLREPFGNAVVEAQLAIRPVVASAALGHLESIVDGETGLLVPPGDATAMANAIEWLIQNPDDAAAIAQRSREVALERFSLARYRSEIASLVASLLKRRPRRR